MFLVAPLGEGYAGYSRQEMREVWFYLVQKHGKPANVRLLWPEAAGLVDLAAPKP